MTRTRLMAVLSGVGAAALWWSATPAQAFVPACDTELSVNYPQILRGDLTACKAEGTPQPSPAIDLKNFTEHLDGTWQLQSRTIQGITQPSNSRYHIELEPTKSGGAVGSAVLLDCSDADCGQSRVAGMWSLDLGATKDRITLNTEGKVALPESKEVKVAMDSATLSKFFVQDGIYVALGKDVGPQLSGKRNWDRVVLTEKTLTYISCAEGRVDRFVKVSPSALVDGTPVKELQKTLVVGRTIKMGERRAQ